MAKLRAVARNEPVAPPPLRYTLDGDARVEARIAQDQQRVADAVAEAVPRAHFVALVLMGGYGRGEGGYIEQDAGPAPYNDYDYFVVVRGVRRGEHERIGQRLAQAARRLEPRVGVEVDFALLRAEALGRAERSLMNAEMRWGHRIVAGDRAILTRMPPMGFHRLRPGEFTRLLLNRGTLLLMNEQWLRRGAQDSPLSPAERECFFKYLGKAVLACGDARLAASGCYHPSYPVKRERLERLDPPSGLAATLGDSAHFLSLYRFAYDNKFHPDYGGLDGESLADWQARTRRLWLDTLRVFESRRLGRSVPDWSTYCRPGLAKGQYGGRGRALRNAAVTLRDYGAGALIRQPLRALRYPRERLIAALPLLLAESGERLDPCVPAALALPGRSDWGQAVRAFLQQWARYA